MTAGTHPTFLYPTTKALVPPPEPCHPGASMTPQRGARGEGDDKNQFPYASKNSLSPRGAGEEGEKNRGMRRKVV